MNKNFLENSGIYCTWGTLRQACFLHTSLGTEGIVQFNLAIMQSGVPRNQKETDNQLPQTAAGCSVLSHTQQDSYDQ